MSSNKQRGNTDNLIPFKKGQSGNPKGSPKKGCTIAEILRAKGEAQTEDGKTRLENLLETVWTMAENKDKWAIDYIADRTEGKPLQATVTSVEELPDGFITKRI